MSKSVLLWCRQIHVAHAAGQYFWDPPETLKWVKKGSRKKVPETGEHGLPRGPQNGAQIARLLEKDKIWGAPKG